MSHFGKADECRMARLNPFYVIIDICEEAERVVEAHSLARSFSKGLL